jgi:hypothetical protein
MSFSIRPIARKETKILAVVSMVCRDRVSLMKLSTASATKMLEIKARLPQLLDVLSGIVKSLIQSFDFRYHRQPHNSQSSCH